MEAQRTLTQHQHGEGWGANEARALQMPFTGVVVGRSRLPMGQ